MSIELLVTRRWFTNRATEGTLEIDGVRECFTLEDRSRDLGADMPEVTLNARKIYGETAVPVGRYRLELYNSPKHGPDTLQLVRVPAFKNVQVHAANRAEELLGCIATGKDRTAPDDNWIGQSKAALGAMRTKVVNRMRGGEPAWIEILEAPELDTRTPA